MERISSWPRWSIRDARPDDSPDASDVWNQTRPTKSRLVLAVQLALGFVDGHSCPSPSLQLKGELRQPYAEGKILTESIIRHVLDGQECPSYKPQVFSD